LVGGFLLGMPSRRTNNFPESGRGVGHVKCTIFGSTVGYPSDSLASCSMIHPSDTQTDGRYATCCRALKGSNISLQSDSFTAV